MTYQENKKRIVFVGAGGHTNSVIDSLNREKYEVIGVYDDSVKVSDKFNILGTVSELFSDAKNNKFDKIFVSIGNNKVRTKILDDIKKIGEEFFLNLISDTSYVSEKAKFEGYNTFIGRFSYIGPSTKIGHNVIINTGSIFEHDSIIKSNSSIATRSVVNGSVVIGENCQIGTGVTIINNINIGNDIVVGSGATVVRSLHNAGVYLGIPAKLVHEDKHEE